MTSNSAAYQQIEQAISYLVRHFKQQPSLEEIAAYLHISPFHFQRLFTQWAGVSPKKFVQYLSVEYSKQLLNSQLTVSQAASEAGFSGASRLHDLFVTIEGMTPGEYKTGGSGLQIRYSIADTPFGPILIASTPKGVCHLTYETDTAAALNRIKRTFPNAAFQTGSDAFQTTALQIFQTDWAAPQEVKLHLAGTPFQLKVWQCLLGIAQGQVTTYGRIAQDIQNPKGCRAVGTAVGQNPVAFLIPCHRVIQSTGKLGGYMWGPTRKAAMLGWEAARQDI